MILKILVPWLRWRAQQARESDFYPAAIQSLVVIELTRLGDFVTVLPAIRRFLQKFPGAAIHVVVDSSHAPLLDMCEPGVNVISLSNSYSPFSFLKALRTVRALRPGLACSMSPANRNAALALASGARFIVGYLNGADSLTPFLGISPVESIGLKEGGDLLFERENIQSRSWKVLQALGIHERQDTSEIFGAWVPEEGTVRDLRVRGVINGVPYVAVHPFSGWEYRSWPIERFQRLTSRILSELGYDVVFVCHASEERQLGPLVRAFSGESRVRFFPSGNMLETAAVLHGADAFVGNDSGPLHLAALLEVPVVGLYGPASPALTAPLSSRGTFLYKPLACSPCDQIRCTRPESPCMELISADDVFASLSNELSAGGMRDVANG